MRSKVVPIASSFFTLHPFYALLLACFLALPAAAQTAEPASGSAVADTASAGASVDTVTVVGTPRSASTPLAGPRIESPQWHASDPGAPEVDTTTYSALPASNPPAPAQPSRTAAGSGGRSDGKGIPWWVLLLVAGGIAVAAH